jgi:hypothetical protein
MLPNDFAVMPREVSTSTGLRVRQRLALLARMKSVLARKIIT